MASPLEVLGRVLESTGEVLLPEDMRKERQTVRQEKRARREELSALDRLGITQALRTLSQPQDAQGTSDDLELQAATGAFGNRPDLNQLFEQNQAKQLFDTLQRSGINIGTGGETTFKPYASLRGNRRVFINTPGGKIVDPTTGAEVSTNEIGPYDRIINEMLTPEKQAEISGRKSAASTEARLSVEGLPVGQVTPITSNRSVVRSIDRMTELFDTNPNLFEKASLPGARVIPDDLVKEIVLLRDTIINRKAFAEGGKQLTNTELARTIKTLDSYVRGEPVSRKALDEVRLLASESLSLLEGSYSKSKIGAQKQSKSDPLGLR